MARVVLPTTAFSRQPTGKHSRPVKEKSYLVWLHDLPCIVTGRLGVEAAHISYPAPAYGKLGRAKGQKESDRWAVPLCAEEHRNQHSMGERTYWALQGIDPCLVALALHGAYPNTGLALLVIQNIERKPPIREARA
jgi:hypothetical protein